MMNPWLNMPKVEQPLRMAHVVIVTPRQCGLYETTRELIAAERALGIDARMYDPAPTKFYPTSGEDRGAVCCDKAWLAQADVIIDHSGCDGSTDNLGTPHILVPHGRPKHSFLGELQGGAPVYSYQYRLERTEKYKAVVTFWPEHVPYLQVIFRTTPVHAIPAPVDMAEWTPEGPKHDFGSKGGKYNLVIVDSWRDDGDVFDALNVAALAARRLPGTKVHLYGTREVGRGWGAILNTMKEEGTLGEVANRVPFIANVYRAADLLLTAHKIQTRVMREAWACGCMVMVCDGDIRDKADCASHALQAERWRKRQAAASDACTCNPLDSAKAMVAIVKGIL